MRYSTRTSHPDELLSTSELAKFLAVPVTTVYSWQSRGGGPPGYRVGRHTRYRPHEVLQWLEERRLVAKSSSAKG